VWRTEIYRENVLRKVHVIKRVRGVYLNKKIYNIKYNFTLGGSRASPVSTVGRCWVWERDGGWEEEEEW
jgi:hypothetical protein